MRKRNVFLFFITILLTLLVLYSCNEPNVVENKNNAKENVILNKNGNTKKKY